MSCQGDMNLLDLEDIFNGRPGQVECDGIGMF